MAILVGTVERYVVARDRAFVWRDALPWTMKIGLALGMACITGLSAQLRFFVPGTPVPVTGQVFAVLLSGVLLGATYGTLGQVFYVLIGTAGLPWFNGWAGGSSVLLGATGGYLLGFIPAAMLVGLVTQRFVSMRRPAPMCAVMLVAVGVIYLAGALQFSAFMRTGLTATLMAAVAPFIIWDAAKALLAATVGAALLPKFPGVRRR